MPEPKFFQIPSCPVLLVSLMTMLPTATVVPGKSVAAVTVAVAPSTTVMELKSVRPADPVMFPVEGPPSAVIQTSSRKNRYGIPRKGPVIGMLTCLIGGPELKVGVPTMLVVMPPVVSQTARGGLPKLGPAVLLATKLTFGPAGMTRTR